MASQAISGVGAYLQRWGGSTWARLPEITSIKGPGKKRDTIEVTSLDSLGGYKEFIGSFREGGSLSLSMLYSRTSYDLMNLDFENSVPQSYELVLPDLVKTSLEFLGLVTELPLNVTAKDAISMDVTILITGKVVVNNGANSASLLG